MEKQELIAESDWITNMLQADIEKTSRRLELLKIALKSYIEAGQGLWLKEIAVGEIAVTIKGNEQVASVVDALQKAGYTTPDAIAES